MILNEIMRIEKKKLIETLIKNSIISKNELAEKELEDKLATVFKEVEKIIEATPNNLEQIQNTIINNFWKKIELIVKNTPGLTIGLKDQETNNELYIYHGNTSNHPNSQKIGEKTGFDLASVTKLFTAVSLLKEEEKGKLDLSKPVNQYQPKYTNIDKPLEDVAKFYYQINTDGRLDTANSKEELAQRLYNSKVVDENTFVYSDIPYIILKDVLQNVDSSFANIFQKELGMINSSYNTKSRIITGGNIDNLDKIHDPKAQKMKEFGILTPGHAGIYSTSKDLIKLGIHLLPTSDFLSKNSYAKLVTPSHGKRTYISRKTQAETNKNRAMGVYIQTDKGISQSDISIASSKEAFAASGTTGPYILMDPTNNYTFNYLCNPYSQEGGVPIINLNGQDKKWASATNIIKEELMNLVYELRYATNVFKILAKVLNSEEIMNATNAIFESKKTIRK